MLALPLDISAFNYANMVAADELDVPYFFAPQDVQHVSKLLEKPNLWFIENANHFILQTQLRSLMCFKPDFAVDISSVSAYRYVIAPAIADCIHDRFGIQTFKTKQIHTCLQEAVINSLIHGNLAIDSEFETLSGYDDFCKTVEQRLANPSYRNKRILIAVWKRPEYLEIKITDQGKGFELSGPQEASKLPHGRGLDLIRQLADRLWTEKPNATLGMIFYTGEHVTY